MENKILLLESTLTIEYDLLNDWIYADWKGDQNLETVKDGCEKILGFLKEMHCQKILNDNTHVTSIWSEAAEWVAHDWFPRATAAGLKYLAWVYSPNVYSKLSADKTLRSMTDGPFTITFTELETAKAWLEKM